MSHVTCHMSHVTCHKQTDSSFGPRTHTKTAQHHTRARVIIMCASLDLHVRVPLPPALHRAAGACERPRCVIGSAGCARAPKMNARTRTYQLLSVLLRSCILSRGIKMTLVLDSKQMKQAIQALISHSEKMKESGATKNLFEDEGDVFNLQIALKKIPEKVSETPVGPPPRHQLPRKPCAAWLSRLRCTLFAICHMHVTHLTPGSHRAPVFSLPYQRRGVPHSQRPPAPLQGSGTIRGSRHVLQPLALCCAHPRCCR